MSRDSVKRSLTLLLIATAFAGSFSHVSRTVVEHGQTGWIGYAVAAMPEVMVLIVALRVGDGSAGVWEWLTGTSAVMFTLAANLAQAEPSVWGWVCAGWPAWAAVSAVGLTHERVSRPELVMVAAEPAVVQLEPAREPLRAWVSAQLEQGRARAAIVREGQDLYAVSRATMGRRVAEALAPEAVT